MATTMILEWMSNKGYSKVTVDFTKRFPLMLWWSLGSPKLVVKFRRWLLLSLLTNQNEDSIDYHNFIGWQPPWQKWTSEHLNELGNYPTNVETSPRISEHWSVWCEIDCNGLSLSENLPISCNCWTRRNIHSSSFLSPNPTRLSIFKMQ